MRPAAPLGPAAAGASGAASYAVLEAALGIGLERGLMERALTHRSYAYEHGGLPNNERLEFLGDAVLGLVVTDALYAAHPDLPEGQLAKLRACVVNTRALAEVARGIGLGRWLRLGKGELATGGPDKASILADTTEALLGAVFLERGLAGASEHGRAPLVRPCHGGGRRHRRGARLEDQPAGADGIQRDGRAGVPRDEQRARPSEVLQGHRSRRRASPRPRRR